MNNFSKSKIIAISILLFCIIALMIAQSYLSDRFIKSDEEVSFFGKESTGEVERLVMATNREDLDSLISSSNTDRILNQAYTNQYNDSHILSRYANIEKFSGDRNDTEVIVKFSNGSVVQVNFSDNPNFRGAVNIKSKIITSAKHS